MSLALIGMTPYSLSKTVVFFISAYLPRSSQSFIMAFPLSRNTYPQCFRTLSDVLARRCLQRASAARNVRAMPAPALAEDFGLILHLSAQVLSFRSLRSPLVQPSHPLSQAI